MRIEEYEQRLQKHSERLMAITKRRGREGLAIGFILGVMVGWIAASV